MTKEQAKPGVKVRVTTKDSWEGYSGIIQSTHTMFDMAAVKYDKVPPVYQAGTYWFYISDLSPAETPKERNKRLLSKGRQEND
jgi:hypothetical protein